MFSSNLNHSDVESYPLKRLYSDRCAYLLISKGWKLKNILLFDIFLEEVKMLLDTFSSIKEEDVNVLQGHR